MQMGNKYGINMGNILSTASSLETAKLNRKINQEKLDTVVAGKKLKANYLSTSNGGKPLYDESQVNALTQQDPDTAIKLDLSKKATAMANAYSQSLQAKGVPKSEADLAANGHSKELLNFQKLYQNQSKAEREATRNNIAQMGASTQQLIEVGKQDPAKANQMFQDYKQNLLHSIKDAYKNNNKRQGDKLQQVYDNLPQTILNKNGSLDAQPLALALGTYQTMLTTAEQMDKIQLQRVKNQTKNSGSGGGVFQHTLDRIKFLSKKKDTTGLNKYEQKELSFLNARVTKQTNPSMDAKEVDFKLAEKNIKEFKSTLPQKYKDIELSQIDPRELTKEQRSRFNTLGNKLMRTLAPAAKVQATKDIKKTLVAIDQLSQAFNKTAVLARSKHSNINFIGKTIRDNFSQYTGMSDDELEVAFRDKRYASAANIIRNALFGSAVSKQENKNFLNATASLYSTNKNIVLGIKSMLLDAKASLEANKAVLSPSIFNTKFGAKERNLNDLLGNIDKVINNQKHKKETFQQQQRRLRINEIKKQYPDATDGEINEYLDTLEKKGN